MYAEKCPVTLHLSSQTKIMSFLLLLLLNSPCSLVIKRSLVQFPIEVIQNKLKVVGSVVRMLFDRFKLMENYHRFTLSKELHVMKL